MPEKEHHHVMRDIAVVAFSVVAAVYVGQSNAVEFFLAKAGQADILLAFLAGFFFTSVFTAAVATVTLAEISQILPIFAIAAIGALGAVLADYFIFRFVRDSVASDVAYLISSKKARLRRFFGNKFLRWTVPVLGALIIASPLPDELGVAMLGLSRTKNLNFFVISYFANFFGILAIGGVANLI